ncbi:MAG TPA: type II toxin-antitoxin system death-on-curing family toxin, partial [Aestuariivirgaceae bacterium]|nr:type II toxin-antitoxin system death-on-curing family toxin [Aestuariivirgaceae bacterium]
MNEPKWLSVDAVLTIHELQLRRFGGPAGIRDQGALESALGRAQNRWAYEQAELPQLAAAYAFGIARNHPFVDGNKRTALLSVIAFLGLNEFALIASEAEAVIMIRGLAAGELDENAIARWIGDNVKLRPDL